MSNAGIGRGCSAEAGRLAGALPSFGRIAVQKPERSQEHCHLLAGLQCRSRQAGRSTASRSRNCSAEAGKLSGALQAGAGTAVQKPEGCQEHCHLLAELQYKSRKVAKSTASRSPDCSTEAGKPSGTLQAGAGIAV